MDIEQAIEDSSYNPTFKTELIGNRLQVLQHIDITRLAYSLICFFY